MSTSNSYEAQKRNLEAEIATPPTHDPRISNYITLALDKAHSKLLNLEHRVKYEIVNRSVVENWVNKAGSPDTVAITLLFDNVKQEDIQIKMTSISLEIKVHNAQGIQGGSPVTKHNYIYKIPKLHKEIDSDESTISAEGTHVLVELRKVVNEKWTTMVI